VNNEVSRKIFVPADESSFARSGYDGVADSGTIDPGDMAENRAEGGEILTVRQVSNLLKSTREQSTNLLRRV
jgi:hypothetical protein